MDCIQAVLCTICLITAHINSLICMCKLEYSSPESYSNLEFYKNNNNKPFTGLRFLLSRSLDFQKSSRCVGDIVHSSTRKEALKKLELLQLV